MFYVGSTVVAETQETVKKRTSTRLKRRWRHVRMLLRCSLDVLPLLRRHRKQQPPRVAFERERRSWVVPTYVRETPRGAVGARGSDVGNLLRDVRTQAVKDEMD